MRKIDLENWPRRTHFEFFKAFDYPHFNLCANVDITEFYPYLKAEEINFTVAVMYVLSRAANEIPEFRQRIRGDEVVEHEKVYPSATVLGADDLFTFCTVEYFAEFAEFGPVAEARISYVKENPILEDEPGQDNLLFMSAIPWVSFTSFQHPIHMHPVDSVPRIAWGKFFKEEERLKMPVSVQGHHAVMDGVHVGRYFEKAEAYFGNPAAVLG